MAEEEKDVRMGRVLSLSWMRVYDGGAGWKPHSDGTSLYRSMWISFGGLVEEQLIGGYFWSSERRCWRRTL